MKRHATPYSPHGNPNTYSNSGVNVKCQFCEADVTTTIEHKNTVVGFALCFIVVLVFGLYGIAISVFLFPLCRSANHRCPKCYNMIISNHFLGLPSLKDEVMTFNIGNCAIIITRKIILILLITCITLMLLVFVMKQKIGEFSRSQPAISKITWDEYRANCGTLAFIGNPKEAWLKFQRDYKYQNVNWRGYIAKITVNVNSHTNIDDHSCILYLKMIPDDFENAISLSVTFDKELYDLHKNTLASISIGQKIEFNATLVDMGTDQHLQHLHGLGMRVIDEKMEIPDELTSFGRYGPRERNS
jgi:hypothetical protein